MPDEVTHSTLTLTPISIFFSKDRKVCFVSHRLEILLNALLNTWEPFMASLWMTDYLPWGRKKIARATQEMKRFVRNWFAFESFKNGTNYVSTFSSNNDVIRLLLNSKTTTFMSLRERDYFKRIFKLLPFRIADEFPYKISWNYFSYFFIVKFVLEWGHE